MLTGYAAARELHRRRLAEGWKPLGRKIGFTNRSIWPRIEPEICFKLASAPPRSSDPEPLLAAIEWVAHAIEIVQCDDPAWQVTLDGSTAQNGLHARLIKESPPLAAGEIVITGTLTDAHPVAPGETWRTEISGLPLGDLELSFR